KLNSRLLFFPFSMFFRSKVDSILGLLLETLFVLPFALLFLAYLGANGQHSFATGSLQTNLLLLVSGTVTAIPLLWFGIGAQKIPDRKSTRLNSSHVKISY